MSWGSRLRSRRTGDRSLGMKVAEDDRILLGLRYPTVLVQLSYH